MYIISSCLLGKNCKYNGGNNYTEDIDYIIENFEYIDICPEELGGLGTPRNPAEIVGEKIIDTEDVDLTEKFHIGAKKVVDIAKKNGFKIAILKEKSPSCGSESIYDGSFTCKLIEGEGITTKALRREGIEVLSENKLGEYIQKLKKRKI